MKNTVSVIKSDFTHFNNVVVWSADRNLLMGAFLFMTFGLFAFGKAPSTKECQTFPSPTISLSPCSTLRSTRGIVSHMWYNHSPHAPLHLISQKLIWLWNEKIIGPVVEHVRVCKGKGGITPGTRRMENFSTKGAPCTLYNVTFLYMDHSPILKNRT